MRPHGHDFNTKSQVTPLILRTKTLNTPFWIGYGSMRACLSERLSHSFTSTFGTIPQHLNGNYTTIFLLMNIKT